MLVFVHLLFHPGYDLLGRLRKSHDREEGFGQFYPNPTNGRTSINIDLQGGSKYDVSIVDMMGRVAHRSSLSAEGSIVYSIDASRLEKGVYLVVFSNGNERIARRIVVE